MWASRYVAGSGWSNAATIDDTVGGSGTPQLAMTPGGVAVASFIQSTSTNGSGTRMIANRFDGTAWVGGFRVDGLAGLERHPLRRRAQLQVARQVSRACQLTNLQNVVRPETRRCAQRPSNRLVKRTHVDKVKASCQFFRLGERPVHNIALAIATAMRAPGAEGLRPSEATSIPARCISSLKLM